MATTTNNIFNNDLFKNKAATANNLNAIQSYLATNDDVFSGKVSKQIQSIEHESIMTSSILNASEPKVARKFEMHM